MKATILEDDVFDVGGGEVMENPEQNEKARAAILAVIGQWQKGVPVMGNMACPVCGKQVYYSRPGTQDRLAFNCEAPECVSGFIVSGWSEKRLREVLGDQL